MMSFPWYPNLRVLYNGTLLVGFPAIQPLRLDLLATKRTLIIKLLGAGNYFIKATELSETIAPDPGEWPQPPNARVPEV